MAAAAELVDPRQRGDVERQFGHSFGSYERLGELLCRAGGVARPEFAGTEAEAWHDFSTGIAENVVMMRQRVVEPGAVPLMERLKFEPMRKFQVVEGKTVSGTGQSFVDLTLEGLITAKEKAATDQRMESEVERSEGDVLIAREVDKLKPGELMAAVSMDPVEAIERDGAEYWQQVSTIGYQKGLAVLQVYYRQNNNTVWAGAYSVKGSNKTALARLLAVNGAPGISVDVPANRFIRHVIRRTGVELDAAMGFGPALHDAYQASIGRRVDNISVTRLLTERQTMMRGYFDTYIKALVRAGHSSQNNDVMQGLAGAMLQAPEGIFTSDEQRIMTRVAGSATFSPEDAKLMRTVIRYACAQDVWRSLIRAYGGVPDTYGNTLELDVADSIAQLNRRMADNVVHGVRHGATGGGCDALRLGETPDRPPNQDGDSLGQQDVFGGTAGDKGQDKSKWKLKWDVCGIPNCPSRGDDPKKPQRTVCGPCGICMDRCQRIFDVFDVDPAQFKPVKRSSLALAA